MGMGTFQQKTCGLPQQVMLCEGVRADAASTEAEMDASISSQAPDMGDAPDQQQT